MSTETVCVLNNSPRKYNLGNPAEGTDLGFHPGATNLPRVLFAKVQSGDDNQAKMLNGLLKQGTFTVIDVKPPLSAEEVAKMRGLDLVRAASTVGDAESRARVAQRVWILKGERRDEAPIGHEHLFQAPMGESVDAAPSDLHHGYKIWLKLYEQKHSDSLLQIVAADGAARRAHEAKLNAIAAMATAKAGA